MVCRCRGIRKVDGFVLELIDGFRSAKIVGFEGTERIINIPSHVTGGAAVVAIGDGVFKGRNLTGVIIPHSIRTIGDRAFSDNHLTGISIPFGVIRIGYQAFMRNRLTSVEIPDSVISIGNQAFSGNRLTSVTILSSLATVGDQAFRGNSITNITIGGNVNIGSTSFGNNFHVFYNNNRKMGGIYTFDGRNWSFSEK